MIYLLFIVGTMLISLYTWGYVNSNIPFVHISWLVDFVSLNRMLNSAVYTGMVAGMFAAYILMLGFVSLRKPGIRTIYIYISVLVVFLFFSFPAFSNDIFNYIATAKVTYFYRENPYLVMPIDIPNEPMLAFMHAANKTALYGPVWILMTIVPHVVGVGNLLTTMYAFKLFVIVFYVLLVRLIWTVTRSVRAVAFFAFNPLVVIDTLISAHNDVVMMYLALTSLYVLKKKRYTYAVILFVASVLIKGATLFLLPVFLYVWWRQGKGHVDWERVWFLGAVCMFAIFMLSPVREEIYSWYFIWVLAFVSLRKNIDIYTAVAFGFTFGLPLRFVPYAATGEWTGITPIVKKAVTIVFPALSLVLYLAIGKRKYLQDQV